MKAKKFNGGVRIMVSAKDAYWWVLYSADLNRNLDDHEVEVWRQLEDDEDAMYSPVYAADIYDDYEDAADYEASNDHLKHRLFITDKIN